MKWKVHTHQAANSAEFRAGAPGPWPRVALVSQDDAQLSPEETAAGWVFQTDVEFRAATDAHRAAWNSFIADWPNPRTARVTRRQEIIDFATDLDTALANWASVTAPQKDALLRRLCRFTLFMIREGKVNFDLD